MSTISLGRPVPEFSTQATAGKIVRLADLRGRNVVLYFYPKDNTSGCTLEAQEFRDRHAAFSALDTVILGVSRDGLRSHENFRRQHDLPFELISDSDETLCRLFDVLKQKKLYGREYLGVERSSFLIDKEGVLRREWRNVKAQGHADEVLAAVQALQ